MTTSNHLESRRLGLRTIVLDNAATWTMQTDAEQARREKRRGLIWFYGIPALSTVPFYFVHIHLQNLGQILAGVSVFTGLLFGLLALMFNTAITIRKEGETLTSAHDLRQLIGDLRANVTYAIAIGILLALVLVVAAAVTPPTASTGWGFTPVVVGLFGHLALTLLTILRRFRTAFNYISR